MSVFENYNLGDRVILTCSGGYPDYKEGMTGTVMEKHMNCVSVKVDNCRKHGPLNFYFSEVRLASTATIDLTFIDTYGDKLEVKPNNKGIDKSDLYFRFPEHLTGVVLSQEQSLELATAIKTYYGFA